MPYKQESVEVFDKGIVDEIGDESIPTGTSSASTNFLDLGDRVELVRGQELIGDDQGSGDIGGIKKFVDVGGTEHLYQKIDTKLQHWNTDTESWDDVITGLPSGEDLSLAPYRTPAGSFVWASSPNSGLYRINLANPTTFVDLYDAAKNFKGYITIQDNRMWLWGDIGNDGTDVGNEVIVRLSYIDNDWPYTDIASEAWDTADGNQTYTNNLAQTLIVGRTLQITHSSETFTDNGDGTLTGSAGGTGTINYTSGAVSITFNAAQGSGAITADYSYEQPKSEGLADFTYSGTRQAGEGGFFFQGQGSDPIQAVLPYDEKFYIPHKESIWIIDLTEDDTNATNKIYRENSGIPFREAAVATGEGIYFIDTANANSPHFRLLKYNEIASRVIPESISDQLDLRDFDFSDSHARAFGDYIVWTCRSSSKVSYNDIAWLYNRKWKLWNKIDATYRGLDIYNDVLHGGSSVRQNTYKLFTGFDDDDSDINGVWEANDYTLGSAELKKCKRFVVWGDMAKSQELIVEISYDGGVYQEVGRIEGTSKYVDSAASTQYGTTLYGSGAAYGSGISVTTFRYMREFRLRSDKFERAKVRFRSGGIGFLNFRSYTFRDIRECLHRVPHKFR